MKPFVVMILPLALLACGKAEPNESADVSVNTEAKPTAEAKSEAAATTRNQPQDRVLPQGKPGDMVNVDAKSAQAMLDSLDDAVVLDVRTQGEWMRYKHIEGSYGLPLDELSVEKVADLKSKKVIVTCSAGNRSAAAGQFLASKGFEVYNLERGLRSWKREKLPLSGSKDTITYLKPAESD